MKKETQALFAQYEQMGRDWLDGKIVIKEFNTFKFHPKQVDFLNDKTRTSLIAGGMASGKTLAFVVKLILLALWFPGSNFLIGRKTQGNAEDTFMKDFVKVCPAGIYTHLKGAHKIVFSNGSTAEFWGLDALQSGAESDIEKAEQKLKSHNFNFAFCDQLEEQEFKVFNSIQSRLRASRCEHAQEDKVQKRDGKGNIMYEVCNVCGQYGFLQFLATTNPANFWGYDYFKVNPRPNTHLIEVSMLDNKSHLPLSFIENEMSKPEAYKLKFLYGQWDDKSMVEGGVFAEEWILNQRAFVRPAIRTIGGIRIFEEPEPEEYQIGADPSLGVKDPCSIHCISKRTGRVVATYTAYVPTNVIAEKAVQMALMYSIVAPPLIVPEATGVGQALIEALKPLYDNLYIRQIFSTQDEEKTTQKVGFYTTYATKTQLIEHMKVLFQAGFPKVFDEDTVNEINKFIYSDNAQQKGAGAQRGYHDDRVMSLMLAFWNVQPVFGETKSSKVAAAQRDRMQGNRQRAEMRSNK